MHCGVSNIFRKNNTQLISLLINFQRRARAFLYDSKNIKGVNILADSNYKFKSQMGKIQSLGQIHLYLGLLSTLYSLLSTVNFLLHAGYCLLLSSLSYLDCLPTPRAMSADLDIPKWHIQSTHQPSKQHPKFGTYPRTNCLQLECFF